MQVTLGEKPIEGDGIRGQNVVRSCLLVSLLPMKESDNDTMYSPKMLLPLARIASVLPS
jgi:hypothetical protein